MFSLDNFYYVLYANFLQPGNGLDVWFNEFGDVSIEKLNIGVCAEASYGRGCEKTFFVFFYDQEPLIPDIVNSTLVRMSEKWVGISSHKPVKLLANSEISSFKTNICRENGFHDWYYFFHGLAALEWYRDYKYFPAKDKKFTKVFITLNHLVSKDRSYRLNLVANLLDRGLAGYGNISCQLGDSFGTWKGEILSASSKLSKPAKKLIYRQFSKLTESIELDINDNSYLQSSARLNLPLQQSALWHVVTETVFYYDKLHLTEKIFKPIVARRPFILVAAPGNLAYLRSYGFKTFDRWIDESYDHETDPDRRIALIVSEIERLCNMAPSELEAMYLDMQEILEFNFNHFYGEFKSIVFAEMIQNFEKCIKLHNVGLSNPERSIELDLFKLDEVYRRLMR